MGAFKLETGEAIVTEYVAATKGWLDARPDLKQCEDVKRSLQEEDVWASAVGWGGIARFLPSPSKSTPRVASDIVVKVNKYLEDHKRCVNALPAHDYVKLLSGIATRLSDDGPQQRIEKLFSNPILIDTWSIVEPSGRVYYVLKEPPKAISPDGAVENIIKYITDYDLTLRSGILKQGSRFGRSPQRDIAVWATEQFSNKQMTTEDWDRHGMKLFEDILFSSDMHPILKASLLYRVVECLVGGDPQLAKDFENVIADLNKIKERYNLDANWMNPDDEQASLGKDPVSRELNRLKIPKDIAAKSADSSTKLWKSLKVAYQPIGFLSKDLKGSWRVRSVKESSPEEHQMVLFRVAKDDSVELIELGRLKAGGVIQYKDESALLEGRLVFAQSPSDQS